MPWEDHLKLWVDDKSKNNNDLEAREEIIDERRHKFKLNRAERGGSWRQLIWKKKRFLVRSEGNLQLECVGLINQNWASIFGL